MFNMNVYLTLTLGIAFAGLGGELFVRGSVGLAHWARITPALIGVTVAAFATSTPEMFVAISSALEGVPEIAVGAAIGSNVVNVALILGLALLVSSIQSSRGRLKRDYPVALGMPLITALLLFDNELSRIDGVVILLIFSGWLAAVAREAHLQRSADTDLHLTMRTWMIVLSCLSGLALLIAGGQLIVSGATGIAQAFGIDAFIVGATIVALGTSAPELATAIVASMRGHDTLGLGTIIGSNIFNGAFIVGIAAVLHPATTQWHEVALTLSVGFVSMLLIYPSAGGFIERKRGFLLLLLYGFYIVMLMRTQTVAG